MRSLRVPYTIGFFVVSLLLASMAMASVVPPLPLKGLTIKSAGAQPDGAIKYVYFPRPCQSLVIVTKIDGKVWGLYYDADLQTFYPQPINLFLDTPSAFVWVLIDFHDDMDRVYATIRPYDSQHLALTAVGNVLLLQEARPDGYFQAWSVMLAPTETFFARNANIFELNHRYMSFDKGGNGIVKSSWVGSTAAVTTLDPITGQSCATHLNEKYNHFLTK